MFMQEYLSTEAAADYLGLKERKLYELAASGGIPCSKVTGKWLFPRSALDRWVESGLSQPEGFTAIEPPPIIGGSHDPLLEWAVRRSGCGLALLSEGSSAGLERLAANAIAMAAIHLHTPADAADLSANERAVAAHPRLRDAVVLAFAQREQGLLAAPGNPLALNGLADAARRGARLGLRQGGAGAQLLLARLLDESTLMLGAFNVMPTPFATGQDLAFAIRAGEVDCGVATRAVAKANGLDFLPLLWERFDLVLRRRTYFEPGPQALFAFLSGAECLRQAELLSGYDISAIGRVRWNA
jgi:excisionase family DNA binding protein